MESKDLGYLAIGAVIAGVIVGIVSAASCGTLGA